MTSPARRKKELSDNEEFDINLMAMKEGPIWRCRSRDGQAARRI